MQKETTKDEGLTSNPNDSNALVMRRCPFCGHEPELILRGNAFTKKRNAEIRCNNCNVEMVVGAVHNSLEWCENKVVEKWNKRTQEMAICSLKYDHEFLKGTGIKECPECGVCLNGA
jgi:hypothetical protein